MTLPDSVKNGLLEGGRVILLAFVSYLLTMGVVDTIVAHTIGTKLDASLQLIITGLITSGLRGIDKWLHERSDKGTGFLQSKGLTGF